MKKTYILFSALTLVLLLSCERTLNVDFSDERPLIVMNGVVEPEKPIEVFVSKSFPVLDTDSAAPYLKDASVELHINGSFVEKMQLVTTYDTADYRRKGLSLFRSKAHAKIGDRVRIEVSAPEFETARAETVIPAPPTIEKVDTASFFTMAETYSIYDYFGYGNIYEPNLSRESFFRMMRLHIGVQRAENNETQYFSIRLSAVKPSDIAEPPYVYSTLHIDTQDDPIFANNPQNSLFDIIFEKNQLYSGSVFFSDNAFKNNAYTLNVSTYGFYSVDVEYEEADDGIAWIYKSHTVENLPIEIKISAISPDWYAYLKSKEQLSNDAESLDIISEPKITYTNVENGIGFIGSMSHAIRQIETPPFPGKGNEIPR